MAVDILLKSIHSRNEKNNSDTLQRALALLQRCFHPAILHMSDNNLGGINRVAE